MGFGRVGGRRRGLLNAGIAAQHFGGEVVDFGLTEEGNDDEAFHFVFELADVARPVVGDDFLEDGEAEGGFGQAHFAGGEGEEVAGEDGDIGFDFAEGGGFEADDVEAVVEVLAEIAIPDGAFEVAISCGDNADIDFDGFMGTDAFDFAFLESAEDFGLSGEAEVADFVEEEGTAVGCFELAHAALDAGSDAAFDAKEFGFDEGFGQGGAVEGDVGAIGAGAEGVEGAGDEVLAGTAFAGDENGDIGGGDAFDHAAQLDDLWGGAHDGGAAPGVSQFAAELTVFGFEDAAPLFEFGDETGVFDGEGGVGGERAEEAGVGGGK